MGGCNSKKNNKVQQNIIEEVKEENIEDKDKEEVKEENIEDKDKEEVKEKYIEIEEDIKEKEEPEYTNRIQIENSRMLSKISIYKKQRNKLNLINIDQLIENAKNNRLNNVHVYNLKFYPDDFYNLDKTEADNIYEKYKKQIYIQYNNKVYISKKIIDNTYMIYANW